MKRVKIKIVLLVFMVSFLTLNGMQFLRRLAARGSKTPAAATQNVSLMPVSQNTTPVNNNILPETPLLQQLRNPFFNTYQKLQNLQSKLPFQVSPLKISLQLAAMVFTLATGIPVTIMIIDLGPVVKFVKDKASALGFTKKLSFSGQYHNNPQEFVVPDKSELPARYDAIIEPMFIGKLKSLGNNIWQSSAGILYVDDKKFGNTLNHVLAHMVPNPTKKNHTVFSVPKEKIIELMDEAWILKGNTLASDPRAYIVDMKKIIGTNGETAIRIVLTKAGTSELLTAYPVKI